MSPESDCPLTPALLQLLQACLDTRSIKTEKLADSLCKSPHTVHSEFRRIFELLDVHDRYEALQLALEQGWVTPAPKSSQSVDSQTEL